MATRLNGGVLIIGSLLWQDGSTKQPWDNARRRWREQYLDAARRVAVQVPIRYGRYSAFDRVPVRVGNGLQSGSALTTNLLEDAQGRAYAKPTFAAGVYTMTLSMDYWPSHLGQAYVYPLRQPITGLADVLENVRALSMAEGLYTSEDVFFNKSWGAVSVLIKPGCVLEEEMRAAWNEETARRNEKERKKWIRQHGSAATYIPYTEQFCVQGEPSCLQGDGSLALPAIATTTGSNLFDLGYDFILGAVTLPQDDTPLLPLRRQQYATPDQIGAAAQVDMRRYFQQNYANGIHTADDAAIWQRIGFR